LPPESRFTPLFGELIQHDVGRISELIPYTMLAFAVAAAAALYVTVFHRTEKIFKAIPIIPHLKPMLGAALTGLIVIGAYELIGRDIRILASLGSGYGFLQLAIDNVGLLTVEILLAVALLKILATSLTIGSGGSGGVFGPSMVIGGSVGAAVGKLFHQLMPGIVSQPGAFAIVGMAGFFAGCANAPFSTILMVSEMTGDYKLLVPTVWVALLSYILCRRWSLYSSQVNSRLDSPAHKGDFQIDLLEGILVREAFKPKKNLVTFNEAATLDKIVHSLTKTPQRYFPVLDSDGKLVGIFSADDVRCSLYDELLWKVANARDVMTEDVLTLAPDDDLNTALTRFTAINVDELPVVDKGNANVVLGFLRRKEVIAAYTQRRLEMRRQVDLERT
jgi:CIC family chloride channel protein